jgi:hypothetical protein
MKCKLACNRALSIDENMTPCIAAAQHSRHRRFVLDLNTLVKKVVSRSRAR